jgi:quercetin dioxygenase-like cupin family protein
MDSVLKAALRRFISEEHIRNVLQGEWVALYDDEGNRLEGIRGRIGVSAMTLGGQEIGIDFMEMQPGSAFPLHTHQGDHILYVVSGRGLAQVGGRDHPLETGDTIFVPAEHPHSFKTYADSITPFQILAVGHPHKHLSATDRMHLVHDHDGE